MRHIGTILGRHPKQKPPRNGCSWRFFHRCRRSETAGAHIWSIMSPQAVAALRRPRHGVALAMLHGANHGAIAGRSGNSFARLRSTMLRLATSTSRAPRVKPQTYPTSWSMTPPRAACRRMVRPTANGDAYRGRLTARAGAAPGIDFLPIRMDRASWQRESLCMHGRQPPHALIGYAPVC